MTTPPDTPAARRGPAAAPTPEPCVGVMVCVNEPEHCLPTGHVVKVDVRAREGLIEVESPGYPDDGPVCRLDLTYGLDLRVGRCRYPLVGYHQCVGNWCCDEAQMRRSQARRLLAQLLRAGWTVVAGPVESDLLPAEVPA